MVNMINNGVQINNLCLTINVTFYILKLNLLTIFKMKNFIHLEIFKKNPKLTTIKN